MLTLKQLRLGLSSGMLTAGGSEGTIGTVGTRKTSIVSGRARQHLLRKAQKRRPSKSRSDTCGNTPTEAKKELLTCSGGPSSYSKMNLRKHPGWLSP
jgi:hypothetical protein